MIRIAGGGLLKGSLPFGRVLTKSRVSSLSAMASRAGGDHSSAGEYAAYYVTVPSKEMGAKIAKSLLNDKLAACVNIIPGVESYYWWDSKIESDPELLLMIKSRASLLESITAKVKEVHEYDTPEVISVPIIGGNPQYLKWIGESTRADQQ